MAGTMMTLGTWKRHVGDAIELRRVPNALGLSPAEVGALVRRKALPVHMFRLDDGTVIRRVRQRDLDMVRASLRKPKLCDLIAAFEVMAAQT